MIFLVSAGMVGAALGLEHGLGIEACPICVTQQLLAGIVATLALAALLTRRRLRSWVLLTGMCLPATMLGAFFSIRHLRIQAMPPEQLSPCGISLEDLIDSGADPGFIMEAMITGELNCGEVAWSLFGISTPGWALIGFVILFLTTLAALALAVKSPPSS